MTAVRSAVPVIEGKQVRPDAKDAGEGDIPRKACQSRNAATSMRSQAIWAQRQPSQIKFSGFKGGTWAPDTGYSADQSYNADVYVFAVLTATSHEEYDPLDVTRWRFWVLGSAQLRATNYASMSLETVRKLAGEPIPFEDLATAIAEADLESTH